LDAFHTPYHTAIATQAARHENTVIVSIHSFTPQLNGRPPRPWHVGVLYADDARLSRPLISALNREPDITVGDNEPYVGHLPGDAIDRHALQTGRHNTLIEIRNDLIETPDAQKKWGQRLAPILIDALSQTEAPDA